MDHAPSDAKRQRVRGPRLHLDTLILAVVAYVPLLLTKRGLLADDTKVYLYLDPRHLLATAASMWNADVGFGTVTHQNIGYLFPMGPYFLLTKAAGLPVWVSQRFWMGSLLFFAALGARRCAEELGLSRRAGWVVAVPYMLTPFLIVDIARTSALLMPWAGLGWMMIFTIRAAHRNDWRNPALFAVVVALTGGVNATSILTVGLAPLAWLVFAGATHEIPWRRVAVVATRIGSLSLLVSLWWLAGLWAEGKYGINILKFTESFATVTTTSTSSEVFRGLGYWYFYGSDGLQPWTVGSYAYMSGQLVPLASFLVPMVGFVAALLIRWRYRLFAVLITFVGLVAAVASYPLAAPTPLGVVLKYLANHTTVGLAMRSTNRVLPLLVLGLALLTGALYDALRERLPRLTAAGAGIFGLVCVVAMAPLFELHAIPANLTLPSTPPTYVQQAAADLNKGSSTSTVLGLPGLDFAYYRYGTYNDSIWPGLLHRPWVSSQVQLVGQPASVNLIRALDSTLQDGTANPASIAPIARLFGASDVLVQMDGQYERYSTPLPPYLAHLFAANTSGMSLSSAYGPTTSFAALNGPYINEQVASLPFGTQWPQSLQIYRVAGARPLVRSESETSPLIVAGDGSGLVSMANLGMLSNNDTIIYDAAENGSTIKKDAAQPGAWLVLTDTNAKRQDTFGTLGSTNGYVLAANEAPSTNEQEQTVPIFPHQSTRAQTVAVMTGVSGVTASSYGNPITNNPEYQPSQALDGSTSTSWQAAAFSPAIGTWWQVTGLKETPISSLHIVQAQSVTINRWITKIGISIDGGPQIVRSLSLASRSVGGDIVSIPATVGRTVRLTVLGVTGDDKSLPTASAIGFAEVGINGFGPATRGLLLPTSLLEKAGTAAATDTLSIVVSRLRASPFPPRLDPENGFIRYFTLPYARSFTGAGTITLNPSARDQLINTILGRAPGSGTSVIATDSSSHITGSLINQSWNAFDGTTGTAWEPRFRTGVGEWVDEKLNHPVRLSTFTLSLVNDGYHMLPTEMSVSNGSTTENFSVPVTMAPRTGTLNTVQSFTITVPAMTGSTFRFTTKKYRFTTVIDRVSGGTNFPPIGIANIAIPGVHPGVTPASFSTGCRNDLLRIDGTPIPIQIGGATASALAGDSLSFHTCNTTPISLSAGTHSLTSASGSATGLNVNDVQLLSPGTNVGPTSTMTDLHGSWYGRTVVRATVSPADAHRWVVLGQSFGPGWHAVLNGHDLGSPTLVDGASMGWRMPAHVTHNENIAFIWEPQNTVLYALILSGIGLLIVAFMAIFDVPRRRRLTSREQDAEHVDSAPIFGGFVGTLSAPPMVLYSTALVTALCVSLLLVPFTLLGAFLWTKRGDVGRVLGAVAVGALVIGVGVSISATLGTWPRDINWPSHVDYSNSFVWVAFAFWMLAIICSLTSRPADSRPARPRTPRTPRTPKEKVVEKMEVPAPEDITSVTRRRSWRRPWSAAPVAAAAVTANVSESRRRGLNVADGPPPPVPEGEEPPPMIIPSTGLRRTYFLLRSAIALRHEPDELQALNAQDSINQVVGKTAIFNRDVLDISDAAQSNAESLTQRGARVTTMRREVPTSRRAFSTPASDVEFVEHIEFTPLHIPAPDNTFDLVFATNIFSCVAEPGVLLEELVRVTRHGGTIYIQNLMWYSMWGGRETSPWHVVSGDYARRRYVKQKGHEPFNRYGVNFFKLRPHQMMRLVRARRDLVVYSMGPRFLPTSWRWLLRVPLLRDAVVQDLVVVVERR